MNDSNTDNDVTLEAALDGLITAVTYCSQRELTDLETRLGRLYQDLAADAPDEDFSNPDDFIHEFKRDEDGLRLCPDCKGKLFDTGRHLSCGDCGFTAKQRIQKVIYERI